MVFGFMRVSLADEGSRPARKNILKTILRLKSGGWQNGGICQLTILIGQTPCHLS
jgi:hypothetical protein